MRLLLLLALAAPVLSQDPVHPPTTAPDFVAVAGSLELTGEMIARPLQPQHLDRWTIDRAELDRRRVRAEAEMRAFTLVEYVPGTDEFVFEVQPGSENAVKDALMATGAFEYVEPNWRVYPIGCPDDSLFGSQWHHGSGRMNSCLAWDTETGDPNVVIAVCDTGVLTTHADLQLHRYEGYNAVTQLWESQGGEIGPVNGHGTLTTGAACANGDNSTGVAGSGWNLGHRMIRVTNSFDGSASMTWITHGVRTAADAGDRVASVSYSGVTAGAVDTAGEYARERGCLLVWAAGNDGATLVKDRADNVVVVGASTSSDGISGFSNRGPFVDLFAPGSGIWTTSSGGGYTSASGTSLACPLAAGLAGLIFSQRPEFDPAKVEQLMRQGCDDKGAAGEDDVWGFGRIDMASSLALIPAKDVLFYDGFESGDFVAGGWVTKNAKVKVKGNSARTGSFGARTRKRTWAEVAIDTSGYDQIEVRFSWRTVNLDAGEEVRFRWHDGTSWTTEATTTADTWEDVTFVLPAAAADNPAFKIRFKTKANEIVERGDFDDVCVFGSEI